MKLQNVYHALQVFVQWIEDGYYDFRSLPYATKSHLCAEDEQKLQQLQEQAYHGKHRSQTYTLSVDIWEFMSSQGASFAAHKLLMHTVITYDHLNSFVLGTPIELLKDFKHITVLLNHIEPNIVKIVSTNPQVT